MSFDKNLCWHFSFNENSHLPGFQALFQEGNDPDAYAAAVKESADAVQGKAGISPSFNPHHLAQHHELTFGTFWTQSKFIQLILIDK